MFGAAPTATLPPMDSDALDLLTTKAYETLKEAIKTESPLAAIGAFEFYVGLEKPLKISAGFEDAEDIETIDRTRAIGLGLDK